jgi:hypothetical protein
VVLDYGFAPVALLKFAYAQIYHFFDELMELTHDSAFL